MRNKIPVTKLNQLFPNDCFEITAKCVECGKEAMILRDAHIYLKCTDGLNNEIDTGCGREYLYMQGMSEGKKRLQKISSRTMLGMFDELIAIDNGGN